MASQNVLREAFLIQSEDPESPDGERWGNAYAFWRGSAGRVDTINSAAANYVETLLEFSELHREFGLPEFLYCLVSAPNCLFFFIIFFLK